MMRQVSGLSYLKQSKFAVVPATLTPSFALKPKSLVKRVFDIPVSYPFSDVKAPEWAGGRTAHFNPEVHPTDKIKTF